MSQFNVGVMKNIYKIFWKWSKGVVIKDLDKNLFRSQFFLKIDKNASGPVNKT